MVMYKMRYHKEPELYSNITIQKVSLCKNIGLFDYCLQRSASEYFINQIRDNKIYTDLIIFSYRYRLMASAGTLYLSRINKNHHFSKFYDDFKSNFLSLYSRNRYNQKKTHPIEQIIKICEKNNGNLCYYCGAYDFDNIDHFLPEGDTSSENGSHFPQLCVMSYNLVPSCGKCNRKKSDHVGEHATNTFIHPYFSKFLDDEFLQCEASFDWNLETITFTYSIALPSTWSLLNKKRLLWEFKRLDLFIRYSTKASGNLNKVKQKYKETLELDGENALYSQLVSEIDSIDNYLGVNNWESVMYVALINKLDDFIYYLKNITTAPPKRYIAPHDLGKI